MQLNFFLNLLKSKETFNNKSTRIHSVSNPKHDPEERLSIYRLYSIEQILMATATFPDRNCSKAFKNTYIANAYDDVDDYKGMNIKPEIDE